MIAKLIGLLWELLIFSIAVVFSILLVITSVYFSTLIITRDATLGFRLISEMRNPVAFSSAYIDVMARHNLDTLIPFGELFGSVHRFVNAIRASEYRFFTDYTLDALDHYVFYDGVFRTLLSVLVENLRLTYIGLVVFTLTFFIEDVLLKSITFARSLKNAEDKGGCAFAFTKTWRIIALIAIAMSSIFVTAALVSISKGIINALLYDFSSFLANENMPAYGIIAQILFHLLLLIATIVIHRIILKIQNENRERHGRRTISFWRSYQGSYSLLLAISLASYMFIHVENYITRLIILFGVVFVKWLLKILK